MCKYEFIKYACAKSKHSITFNTPSIIVPVTLPFLSATLQVRMRICASTYEYYYFEKSSQLPKYLRSNRHMPVRQRIFFFLQIVQSTHIHLYSNLHRFPNLFNRDASLFSKTRNIQLCREDWKTTVTFWLCELCDEGILLHHLCHACSNGEAQSWTWHEHWSVCRGI